MARRRYKGSFFVENEDFVSPGAALSYAQGLASAWKDEARSFYVRNALDECLYRVDLDEDKIIRTHIAP